MASRAGSRSFLAGSGGARVGAPDWVVPAAALAVFLGHLYPVFHGFAGGKGVSTAAGIVFALHWPLGLALLVDLAHDGVRLQDFLARRAHGGRADAARRILLLRQLARPRGRWCRSPRCCSGGTAPTSGSWWKARKSRSGAERDRARCRLRADVATSGRGERSQVPARLDREKPKSSAARARPAAARRPARSSRRCRCRTRGRESTRRRRAPRFARKPRAQFAVGADAARDHQPCAGPSRRAPRATSRPARRRSRVWNSRAMSALRASGSVSGARIAGLAPRERQHGGLEPREAEVEVAGVEHRPRQLHRTARSPLRQRAPAPDRPDTAGPSSFAVLSNASPAASSSVSPSSR